MSAINIRIEIDNEIFHEDLPGEVRRILDHVVGNLGRIADNGSIPLQDINGNTVGAAAVDTEEFAGWACDKCGCTDVQETAWIHMNTGENTGDEGPLNRHWCPQCGDGGDGEVGVSQLASEPQPYDPDREPPADEAPPVWNTDLRRWE